MAPVLSRFFEHPRRRRAARDMARRLAELDRLDREYGLGTMPAVGAPPRLRRFLGFDNERLTAAPQVQEGQGPYSFMQTQMGSDDPGRLRYATGRVVLDRDVFASLGPRDVVYAQAIVDHEFAHLVGLGHVDDPGELMNEADSQGSSYGPGDREGLARLGSIRC